MRKQNLIQLILHTAHAKDKLYELHAPCVLHATDIPHALNAQHAIDIPHALHALLARTLLMEGKTKKERI